MRWVVIAASALLVACSFAWDDFDPRQRAQNPSGGGDAGGMGGAGGSDCPALFTDPPGDTFGPAEPIPIGAGDDPHVSHDLLELYFNADGGERFTIWRATRSCPGDPWGDPHEVAELDTGDEATSPVLSPDGLTLYLSYADDPTLKIFDIHESRRDAPGDPWSAPVLIPQLQSFAADRANWISADGATLGLDSARSGDLDLFIATRSDADPDWGIPTVIGELTTDADESESSITGDGLTIVFGRDVPGVAGEIFRAERSSPSATWDPPQPIAELNTSADESDPWISPDGRIILFTRQVRGEPLIHQAVR